jgi:hypothetical protein
MLRSRHFSKLCAAYSPQKFHIWIMPGKSANECVREVAAMRTASMNWNWRMAIDVRRH